MDFLYTCHHQLKQTAGVIAITSATIFVGFYLYRRRCHRYFSSLDIPGPKPHFLYGNLREIWRGDRHLVFEQWSKQYGKIFGFYEGPRPVLVIGLPKAVESVCIEQSSDFSGRMFVTIQPDSVREPDNELISILIGRKNHWKVPRHAASPFFAHSNLKCLVGEFERKAADLLDILDEKAALGEPFDIRDPLQRFAMELFGLLGLGIEMDLLKPKSENSPSLKVYQETTRLFENVVINPPALLLFVMAVPELSKPIRWLANFLMRFSRGVLSSLNILKQLLTPVISASRKRLEEKGGNSAATKNLIQLFVDKTAFKDGPLKGNCYDAAGTKQWLSEGEVVTNSIALLMAGYETTSTTFSYICYSVAMHPPVQDKLYEEICRYSDALQSPVDYDVLINKMQYLDWVCKETIRLYCEAVYIVSRFADANTQICGIPAPKPPGSVVVDVWSIHMNEEYWGPVDPRQFYPDRFAPEYSENRPASAYLGFGLGPHECLGKRFAMLELKLTLIRLLRKYRLLPEHPNAPVKLPVRCTHIMVPADHEIRLRLEKR